MVGAWGARRAQLRRQRRLSRGAAAVEFALITFFVLAPLLVGMIQTGWSLYNALSVGGAVRDGARFAATGDASKVSWATDVTTQVRSLTYASSSAQANQTSVCVGLYKEPTYTSPTPPPPPALVKFNCNVVSGVGPPLSLPLAGADPARLDGLALDPGQCVVRVVAARNYRISFVLGSVPGTMTRGSVARYERGSC